MKPEFRFITLSMSVILISSACSLAAPTVARPADHTATNTLAQSSKKTAVPADAPSATPEPPPTPTPVLLDLEILEWSEWPYANPADPSSTDTHVEVLIRNPNDIPVRVLRGGVEVRFLNSSGEVVYANPSPFFYIWEGSWMLPGGTGAFSACVCFWTSGMERKEWESLELVVPIEVATDLAYTLDVDVTLGEFFSLAEAHLGGSGLGAQMTLTNRSDYVLESIPTLVFARDSSGRYIGMAIFGSAVASFTEDIGIQPGDSATGVEVNLIEYFNGPMTYEVQAIGIIDSVAHTSEPRATGMPLADWQGIPIMPGAQNGRETDDGYQFSTQATIDEIAEFYETALAELGYSLSMTGEQSGVTFLIFENSSTSVIVGILPSAELNLVEITVSS